MSYEEFKRTIDTARDILVGAVPSPAGQIDQITYALMYKFMSDIDDQSAALGGKRKYFVDDYEKYNWHALMSPQLGAHERLELYREAIQTMAKNPNLPGLFREIYQNAFLPFNSANVLNLFLKEIDKFTHDENDDIGDAYEYLLSITGAQGDVGQFRTPRHIIEFIVKAVNPTKDDSVLDPSVGTAGFLIAAYNHVKSQHDGRDEEGKPNNEKELTSDEKAKLHGNYYGFDIDPTMVRTAKVNMYLHGFKTPNIQNHDTLSSEEYWDKRYDVILANPPFMTPRGGIEPHRKFSITANRAEVLFVDYIASHLKPSGRAGIVVPEGIIFQSSNAHKDLRKNLVENSLYAVVSLPAGVFNPYAGVKTSVLLLDRELAKKRDEILFVKIENDGYSLNAQRRKVTGDQLPEALQAVERFKNGEELQSELAHAVPRSEVAESGDYNLSGDRYRVSVLSELSDWPVVAIGEYVDYVRGLTYSKRDEVVHDGFKVLRANNIDVSTGNLNLDDVKLVARSVKVKDTQRLSKGDIFICAASGSKEHIGKVSFIPHDTEYYFGGFMAALRTKPELDSKYLFYQLRSKRFNEHLRSSISGVNINNLNAKILGSFKVPLPPIEIQREIVAELDGYQKIIDAAQTIVQTYKPNFKINSEWTVAAIDELVDTVGATVKIKTADALKSGAIPIIDQSQKYIAGYTDNPEAEIRDVPIVAFGDHTKAVKYVDFPFAQGADGIKILKPKNDSQLISKYLFYAMSNIEMPDKGYSRHWTDVKRIKIPLPPIETQREIVAELEAEQQLINANKKLIEIYQQKIKSKIAEVWGE